MLCLLFNFREGGWVTRDKLGAIRRATAHKRGASWALDSDLAQTRCPLLACPARDDQVDIDRRMVDYVVGLETEFGELVEGSYLYTPTVAIDQVVLPAHTKVRRGCDVESECASSLLFAIGVMCRASVRHLALLFALGKQFNFVDTPPKRAHDADQTVRRRP